MKDSHPADPSWDDVCLRREAELRRQSRRAARREQLKALGATMGFGALVGGWIQNDLDRWRVGFAVVLMLPWYLTSVWHQVTASLRREDEKR